MKTIHLYDISPKHIQDLALEDEVTVTISGKVSQLEQNSESYLDSDSDGTTVKVRAALGLTVEKIKVQPMEDEFAELAEDDDD